METVTWTVYRSVFTPEDYDPEGDYRRLDVREGWPSPPQGAEIDKARKWVEERFKSACKACGLDVAMDGEAVHLIHPMTDRQHSSLEFALRRPLVPMILWRPFVTRVDDNAVREFLYTLRREDQLIDYTAKADVSSTSQEFIEECAMRSLHDWRSALRFLARLRHCEDGRLELDEPDSAVIDSFNNFIVSGRRHNLAHTMLGHLAQRARIRLLLTTNFDTLIEDAFAELHEPLRSVAVHLQDSLPHPDAVHCRSTLLKLHGESIETRADFSLDLPPSPEDKRRFFHYIQGNWPGSVKELGYLPGLLLVCGYSGNDLRSIQYIKHMLDTEPAAKVLWICHSQRDLENLYVMFEEQGYRIARNREELDGELATANRRGPRIVATVTDRTDLILYELYQRLTLSLPPGGSSFQFIHNVPPGTSFTQTPRTEEVESDFARDLVKALLEEAKLPEGRTVVADGASGVSGPLRQAFNNLTREKRKQGIWLELEDYADVSGLAHEILTIISIRRGEFQRDYAQLLPPFGRIDPHQIEHHLKKPNENAADSEKVNDAIVLGWREHIELLLRKWSIDPADWVIILYGRNGPGGCATWGLSHWPEDQYRQLNCFLRALRKVRRPAEIGSDNPNRELKETNPGGFNILYAPFSQSRWERDKQKQEDLDHVYRDGKTRTEGEDFVRYNEFCKFDSIVHVVHRVQELPTIYRRLEMPHRPPPSFDSNLAYVATSWIQPARDPKRKGVLGDVGDRLRFLYASVLFRQSRHFSAFLSEGVYPCPQRYNLSAADNDWRRHRDVLAWLNELNSRGQVFFRKPGGFAWMFRDTRLAIQLLIQTQADLNFTGTKSGTFIGQKRARTHYWIADWHLRAFRATGHALPLLEACYHFFSCIRYIRFADLNDAPKGDAIRHYRWRLLRRSLFEMTKALRVGRDRIQYWIQNAGGEAWFGLRPTADLPNKPLFGAYGGSQLLTEIRNAIANDDLRKPETASPEGFNSKCWLQWLEEELRNLPQNRSSTVLEERSSWTFDEVVKEETPAPRAWPATGNEAAAFNFKFGNVSVYSETAHNWFKEIGETVVPRLPLVKDPGMLGTWGKLLNLLAEGNVEGTSPVGRDDEAQRASDLNLALKGWRNSFVQEHAGQGPVIHLVIQGVFELAYLCVRRAKALEHIVECKSLFTSKHKQSSRSAEDRQVVRNQIRSFWARVCGLCWLGLDLCTELPPALWMLDCHERYRVSTLYGLALGRLNRFFEAHRRLNEAAALRAQPDELHSRQSLGIVSLRRAEVYLIEASRLRQFLAYAVLYLKYDLSAKNLREWLAFERFLAANSDQLPVANTVGEDSGHKEKYEQLFKSARGSFDGEDIGEEQFTDMYLGNSEGLFERADAKLCDGERKDFEKRRADAWMRFLRRLQRLHYARLDDAWTTLESAAEHLRETHTAIWTSRLNALRLLVFALYYPEDIVVKVEKRQLQLARKKILAFRHREDHIMAINALFRAGVSESDHRRHADIRLVDYAWRAVENLEVSNPERYLPLAQLLKRDIRTRVNRLEELHRHEFDGLLGEYLERVKKETEKETAHR